jgi:hypothetical protein
MFGASMPAGVLQAMLPYGGAQEPLTQATPLGQRSGLRGQHGVATAGSWALE